MPDTYKVTGTVTLYGKPVSGASVNFTPKGGRPGLGLTDDEGGYTLTTFESHDGALPGQHAVTVSMPAPPSEGGTPVGPSKAAPQAVVIPVKYSNPQTTPFKFNVTEDGDNHFDLKIE